jgi:hypothetical protein
MSSAASPTSKRNLVMRRVGRTVVMVQNAETPTDEEWNEFLRIVKTDASGMRLLVMTDGGSPNAAQRKRLEVTLGGALPLVAVVSDNIKIRFVAATIALFHRTHGLFSKSDKPKAFEHLRLDKTEWRPIENAIEDLIPLLSK